MKVLWVCNLALPQFCEALGIAASNVGGWMSQTFDKLNECEEIELGVCAPSYCKDRIKRVEYCGTPFWEFKYSKKPVWKYDIGYEDIFREIIDEFKPDILHIFGTEFPHSLAAIRAFDCPERTVIHLQGIISVYSRYYNLGVPLRWINHWTIRDLLRHDNLAWQQKKFELRGKIEVEAINRVDYVMGRTDWDKACALAINPNITYLHCNENLRKEFNDCLGSWSLNKCERHSIFISQGSYPIKGLHIALQAIAIVKRKYPDTKLFLTGDNPMSVIGIKDRIRMSTYQRYIRMLINKLQLNDSIFFLGNLTASEMIAQYKKAHVYLMPSTIENSPNSLLEAMWVGTPAVATYVGGIPSMASIDKEVLLVPSVDYESMASCICKIFGSDEKAIQLSVGATVRAKGINDLDNNIKTVIEDYGLVYDHMAYQNDV